MFSAIDLAVKGTVGRFPLARLNGIVGENRAGKTSIHDGIRLAATGEHPIGRYGKDIAGLLPPGLNQLHAQLYQGDKLGPSFRLWRESDKYKREWELRDAEPIWIPPVSYRALIDQSSTLAAEAILKRFGEGVVFPPGDILSDHVAEIWDEMYEEGARLHDHEAGILAEIRARIRSVKQSNGHKKGALNGVLATLKSDGSDVGGELLPAMWAAYDHGIIEDADNAIDQMRLRELRSNVEAAIEARTFGKVFARVESEIEKLDQRSAILKVLEARATRRIQFVMELVAKRATEAVNASMTDGFGASFAPAANAEPGDLIWTVTGKDGRPHSGAAISGAEAAVLSLALARVWDPSPNGIALFDDDLIGPFHSSPANLRAFLKAIEEAVEKNEFGMVSVAGLRANEVPEHWNMIVLV